MMFLFAVVFGCAMVGMAQVTDNLIPTCPICKSPCVPMRGSMTGKGWNCSRQTWSRQHGRGGCSGTVWNKGSYGARKAKIERPAQWLVLDGRTPEQGGLRTLLGTPGVARCVIVNAVAGSGKSTSMADCVQAIWERVKSGVANWYLCAFNVNAAESLQSKIPESWPNIGTINSTFGRLQGFVFKQYKKTKIANIFAQAVQHLPREERPRPGPLAAIADRMRDMLVYCDECADRTFWIEALAAIVRRFPGLAKKLQKRDAEETIREYLPLVLTQSVRINSEIDLTEQYARPALDAIRGSKWRVRWECLGRGHEWTEGDYQHLATLIRTTRIAQCSLIVDEAQDISPSQLVAILAATCRGGELVLVGDDKEGLAGESHYKAGQGIFGWRGAGGGIFSMVRRLWPLLTGNEVVDMTLSVSFRCPPETCAAVASLCPRMRSNRPVGAGETRTGMNLADAWQCWIALPEGKRGLWLARRNRVIAERFMQGLKDQVQGCLRGGGDFASQVDAALTDSAGWYDNNGEYRTSLAACIAKMQATAAESEDSPDASGDTLESFLLVVAEAIQRDPQLLRKACDGDGNGLEAVATVGNLRRFVHYFASKDAPRVYSTVYRAKGDEADLVVIDDCESFNESWNGDDDERRAVTFVAGTRSKDTTLVLGEVDGITQVLRGSPGAGAFIRQD